MASGFKTMFGTFLLVGLFFFAMISFAVQVGIDNDSNASLLQDQTINSTFSSYSEELSESQDITQEQKEGFESETPTQPGGDFLLVSVISSGTTFASTIVTMFNITFRLFSEVLGISPIVLAVLTSILIVTILFGLWRLYKTGE